MRNWKLVFNLIASGLAMVGLLSIVAVVFNPEGVDVFVALVYLVAFSLGMVFYVFFSSLLKTERRL